MHQGRAEAVRAGGSQGGAGFSTQTAHFDDVHAGRDDPWGVTSRWYEIRKRSILLASLPDQHYRRTLELGCSVGAVTEALAERSEHVVAVDVSAKAIERAAGRVGFRQNVTFTRSDMRDGIPAGPWDLVVLSEVGYYLEKRDLATVIAGIERTLAPEGSFVACHWRHPEPDFAVSGDDVHLQIARRSRLHRTAHHEEVDFVLDVYGVDGRSVAARTGLVSGPGPA